MDGEWEKQKWRDEFALEFVYRARKEHWLKRELVDAGETDLSPVSAMRLENDKYFAQKYGTQDERDARREFEELAIKSYRRNRIENEKFDALCQSAIRGRVFGWSEAGALELWETEGNRNAKARNVFGN